MSKIDGKTKVHTHIHTRTYTYTEVINILLLPKFLHAQYHRSRYCRFSHPIVILVVYLYTFLSARRQDRTDHPSELERKTNKKTRTCKK